MLQREAECAIPKLTRRQRALVVGSLWAAFVGFGLGVVAMLASEAWEHGLVSRTVATVAYCGIAGPIIGAVIVGVIPEAFVHRNDRKLLAVWLGACAFMAPGGMLSARDVSILPRWNALVLVGLCLAGGALFLTARRRFGRRGAGWVVIAVASGLVGFLVQHGATGWERVIATPACLIGAFATFRVIRSLPPT